MKLRHAVALIVVVDMLVAVVQMQQAIIERASFQPPAASTFAQWAVTMSSGQTKDDVDLYVRDPAGDIAWYGSLQAGPLSLLHDTIPGTSDPYGYGLHELTVVRSSEPGEYVANVHVYAGSAPVTVTVSLWDLRGLHKRVVFSREILLGFQGEQRTAFRWTLNVKGELAGHSLLPVDLLSGAKISSPDTAAANSVPPRSLPQ